MRLSRPWKIYGHDLAVVGIIGAGHLLWPTPKSMLTILHCLAYEMELLGCEDEKVGREQRPVGIGAHLE
jgi:hypothetical protein